MSSILPLPSLRAARYFTISIKSLFSRTLKLRFVSSPSLSFIFNLPTGDKSYLSLSKNKFLKSLSAASKVGGSPGLKIL